MNHFIAMNPQRGGNKGSASCLPLAEYDKLIAQPWLHDMVEQIRGGNDKLKGLMPFRCGHYSRFLKNHRSQKDADPTSFLFQTTIDIDDKELVGIAIEMARQLNCSDSIWKGMLLHLEYSARKKLHIDIRMPIGMTIEETQRAYCEALGVPCDESCFTPERIFFITDQDSEIYRSKDWYAVLPADELKARREAYLKRGLTIDGRGDAKVNSLQLIAIVMTMFKIIDFRALTAILLFLMALLFSLPNLVIAMVLMLVISALLEAIRFLTDYQPLVPPARRA